MKLIKTIISHGAAFAIGLLAGAVYMAIVSPDSNEESSCCGSCGDTCGCNQQREEFQPNEDTVVDVEATGEGEIQADVTVETIEE